MKKISGGFDQSLLVTTQYFSSLSSSSFLLIICSSTALLNLLKSILFSIKKISRAFLSSISEQRQRSRRALRSSSFITNFALQTGSLAQFVIKLIFNTFFDFLDFSHSNTKAFRNFDAGFTLEPFKEDEPTFIIPAQLIIAPVEFVF